jgi:HlyD family secretion protein
MRKIILAVLAIGMILMTTACGSQVAASSTGTKTEEAKQNIEAYGIVKATDIKNITLDFQAPILKINVKEGEKVKAGQSLVTLDITDLNAQIENKKLALQISESNRNLAGKNTDLRKLQNDLESAQDIYSRDNEDLSSKEKLYEAGSISLTDLQACKKLVENDKKNITDITYAIEDRNNNKGMEKEQKSIESAILESDIKLLNNKLIKPYINGSDIISDVGNGLVYDIWDDAAGDIAGPQKKLLSLMNLDSLIIEANVPEEFIKDVKIGAKVEIIPTADKSKKYAGKVTYISSKAYSNNGETLVAVFISIDNKDDFLLPYFNVDVKIKI